MVVAALLLTGIALSHEHIVLGCLLHTNLPCGLPFAPVILSVADTAELDCNLFDQAGKECAWAIAADFLRLKALEQMSIELHTLPAAARSGNPAVTLPLCLLLAVVCC